MGSIVIRNRSSLETIVRELEEEIEAEGFDQKANKVSGMNTTQVARTITDVTFVIREPSRTSVPRQIDFDNFIKDAHGEDGLCFIKVEGIEWFESVYENPGNAWKEDPERWHGLLDENGKMGYTYNDRLRTFSQFENALVELHTNNGTRQAYISIYEPKDSGRMGSNQAMPCVIGYQLTMHDGKLDMSVLMRSCDITNCLRNDIWLADNLLSVAIRKLNQKAEGKLLKGNITFHIINLHKYNSIKP